MRIKTLLHVAHSRGALILYPYFRAKYKYGARKPKIKLVAIAKNESAYLAEWIYHHLYFGFDHIDIYYNGCTDNTVSLAEEFDENVVNFINADPIFAMSEVSPQMDIYRPEFVRSRKQGFDHVMFLDIDEFWIPFDLTSSIKDYIENSPYFDSMCFQWANKVDETAQFSRAINQKIIVEPARQLKTIHKSFITPGLMNPHNILDSSLIRLFSDGTEFISSNPHHSMAPQARLPEKAFILHRKYRSQLEYVALLGRGRPIGPQKVVSEFKNNRDGYYKKNNSVEVVFDSDSFIAYDNYMTEQLSHLEKNNKLRLSRESVVSRFNDVVEAIKQSPPEEMQTLTKILKNVDIAEVQLAFSEFKRRSN